MDFNTLLPRAQRALAGGPATFSKHWTRYPQGIAPPALISGDGCYVVGTDGKRYIDTVAALGPILLGYNHPAVTQAVMEQVRSGTSFSMLHPLEVEVAELLSTLLPCAEMVRFMRNGTDATNAAVRLARAVTGHKHVIFAGYHGGGMDSYGITTDRAAGILPQLFPYNHQTPWNDLFTPPRHAFDDLAAIMIEIPPYPWMASEKAVCETLRIYQETAHLHGALCILDEIVTFPRYHVRGAQTVYGITPDLCCLSKGIANGFPLAALVGQRRYMERFNDGDVFVSYTFAGETTALAACKATLEFLRETDALTNLHRHGQTVGDDLCALLQRYALPASLYGHPSRLQLRWHDTPKASASLLRTLWLAEHARRGILHGIGVMLPMTCYTSSIVYALLAAAEETCIIMRQALDAEDFMSYIPCEVIENVLSVRAT